MHSGRGARRGFWKPFPGKRGGIRRQLASERQYSQNRCCCDVVYVSTHAAEGVSRSAAVFGGVVVAEPEVVAFRGEDFGQAAPVVRRVLETGCRQELAQDMQRGAFIGRPVCSERREGGAIRAATAREGGAGARWKAHPQTSLWVAPGVAGHRTAGGPPRGNGINSGIDRRANQGYNGGEPVRICPVQI